MSIEYKVIPVCAKNRDDAYMEIEAMMWGFLATERYDHYEILALFPYKNKKEYFEICKKHNVTSECKYEYESIKSMKRRCGRGRKLYVALMLVHM